MLLKGKRSLDIGVVQQGNYGSPLGDVVWTGLGLSSTVETFDGWAMGSQMLVQDLQRCFAIIRFTNNTRGKIFFYVQT